MTVLQKNELIDFILPTVLQLFNMEQEEKRVREDLDKHSTLFGDFIYKPDKSILTLRKREGIIVRTVFESSEGSNLFLYKNAPVLYNNNFLSNLTVIPLSDSSDAHKFSGIMNAILGKLFLPTFRNIVRTQDKLEEDVLNSITGVSTSVQRLKSENLLSDSVLHIGEEDFKEPPQTYEKRCEILDAVDDWHLRVKSLLQLVNEPPKSDNLRDEVTFWCSTYEKLSKVKDEIEKLEKASFFDFISEHRNRIKDELEDYKKTSMEELQKIETFSKQMQDLSKSNFLDDLDKCDSLDELQTFVEKSLDKIIEILTVESNGFRAENVFVLLSEKLISNTITTLRKVNILGRNVSESESKAIVDKLADIIFSWKDKTSKSLTTGHKRWNLSNQVTMYSRQLDNILTHVKNIYDKKSDFFKLHEELCRYKDVFGEDTIKTLDKCYSELENSSIFELLQTDDFVRKKTFDEYSRKLNEVGKDIASVITDLASGKGMDNNYTNLDSGKIDIFYVNDLFVKYHTLTSRNEVHSILEPLRHSFSESMKSYVKQIHGNMNQPTKSLVFSNLFKKDNSPKGCTLLICQAEFSRLNKIEEMLKNVIGTGWEHDNMCQEIRVQLVQLRELIESVKKDSNKLHNDHHSFEQEYVFDVVTQKSVGGDNVYKLVCNFDEKLFQSSLLTLRTIKQGGDTMQVPTHSHIYSQCIKLNDALQSWMYIQSLLESEEMGKIKSMATTYIEKVYYYFRLVYNKKWDFVTSQEGETTVRDLSTFLDKFFLDAKERIALFDKIDKGLVKVDTESDLKKLNDALFDIYSLYSESSVACWQNEVALENYITERATAILNKKIDSVISTWEEKIRNNEEIISVELRANKEGIVSNPGKRYIYPELCRRFSEEISLFTSLELVSIPSVMSTDKRFYELDLQKERVNNVFEALYKNSQVVSEYLDYWSSLKYFFNLEPNVIGFDNLKDWTVFVSNLISLNIEIEGKKEEVINNVKIYTTSESRRFINEKIAEIRTILVKGKYRDKAQSTIKNIVGEIKAFERFIYPGLPESAQEISKYLRDFKKFVDNRPLWTDTFKYLETGNNYCQIDKFDTYKNFVVKFLREFQKREKEVEANKEFLRQKVEDETKSFSLSLSKLRDEWNAEKPINDSTLTPEQAIAKINKFEPVIRQEREHWKQISDARELIDLKIETMNELEGLLDDCNTLSEVWSSLSLVYRDRESLLSTPFSSFIPNEFRNKFQSMIDSLQQMPEKIRNYEPWHHFHNQAKSLLNHCSLLESLRSPAIRTRHWKLISARLSRQITESITVQGVIDLGLDQHSDFVAEVIRNAQGEYSLHQYLETLDVTWNQLELEFMPYNDKQLLKGWDVIMATISDHLNFLGTMQTSPFFNTFREKANQWTSTLNQLLVLLDQWIDVQRRFIYLDGVFSSKDIQSLLEKASRKFVRSSADFSKLTKQVHQTRLAIKILSIENISTSLTNLNDSLVQLQKELSNYLEKQRTQFPRFFFIGDEDLLEIIGKSSRIYEIQKHFSKMFEGLAAVIEKDNAIHAIKSAEGEQVDLNKPIPTNEAIYQLLVNIEREMKLSLGSKLTVALGQFRSFWDNMNIEELQKFISNNASQVCLLAFFIISTTSTEEAIRRQSVRQSTDSLVNFLRLLSQMVFTDLTVIARHTVQQLITECVHQRNISRDLLEINSIANFGWTRFMRFYEKNDNEVLVRCGDAEFNYGFEYLGLCPSLVRTPLTDRVYLTLAQALFQKLGGSPFGPAGTGKTETVKNMGHHLGRHVLVFNCDETFDFSAMGRIFIGLCHCGSWGCFDEFNRLDEQMLSSVSQQIQAIQYGLRMNQNQIQILDRKAPLNQSVGIFITMNPGYAGRVELPDNLKQLFRSMAMNKPDTDLITEVMLFSQGFASAEKLAPKFVILFSMAKESLSSQTHYDFGLRSMKSVLTNAGQLIRMTNEKEGLNYEQESGILVSSLVNTLFPKLLSSDLIKLKSIISDVFPNSKAQDLDQENLYNIINEEAVKNGWITTEDWVNKIIQVYYIQQINHGFMLVGPSATGKTSARTLLLSILSKIDKVESESYVINPKSVTKDSLFGFLDPVTREWTDGIFTSILRTIVNDQRGEMSKRHWIIFDGDVDPEWVENLNSVLDDNKLLTLPNGERIALPPNVRVVFEVSNLNYATPATVSRCGIVYFSRDVLKYNDIVKYHIYRLSNEPIIHQTHLLSSEFIGMSTASMISKQKGYMDAISTLLLGLISACADFWSDYSSHAVVEVPFSSCLASLFSLLSASFVKCLPYEQNDGLLEKAALFSTFWGFASPFEDEYREILGSRLVLIAGSNAPKGSLLQNNLSFETDSWTHISEIRTEKHSDGYIGTSESTIDRFLFELSIIGERPVVFYGPTGCGKKSLIASVISIYSDIQLTQVDLSSCSTIDFVLKTLEHYCVYTKSATSLVMKPKLNNTYLVFLFNNLNLPVLDNYGTQRVVELLRQVLESKGFWHPQKREWIQLSMISFAAVCSPQTFYGRIKLSERFLRHTSVTIIRHPSPDGLLKIVTQLLDDDSVLFKEQSASAICRFYSDFKEQFRASEQIHYLANIGDIASWIGSFLYMCKNTQSTDQRHLLFYEGIRVFMDRLETPEDKQECRQLLKTDILSSITDGDNELFESEVVYTCLDSEVFSCQQRLLLLEKLTKKYAEYSVDVSKCDMVFFDEAIDLFCRLERVFSQPECHAFLIGLSGTGKVRIPYFVAWTLGMRVFRLCVHKDYGSNDFDIDIRKVLRTCIDTKVCLIIKDSDLISSIFTERLNVLLSECQIPGLFTGDEYNALVTAAKDASRASGVPIDSDESAFNYFLEKVRFNLHIVFTSNSAVINMNDRNVTFPSLFSKAYIHWVGNWSESSLSFFANDILKDADVGITKEHIRAMIDVHFDALEVSKSLPIQNFVSPRHFFEFVKEYCVILKFKSDSLHTEQTHINMGLSKLKETQEEVNKMRSSLEEKKKELGEKEQLAEKKLDEIIKDRTITSQKKEEAQKIQEAVREKTDYISEQKAAAQSELNQVQPLVDQAYRAVNNISKKDLTEMRSLSNPPEVIKATLSAVLTLLGKDSSSWAVIKRQISGDSFIKSILDFKVADSDPSIAIEVRRLIDQNGLTYEKAHRASEACGPLFTWIEANIDYLKVLKSVLPLKEKVAALEKEAEGMKEELNQVNDVVSNLESSLKAITNEYQQLTSQCDQTRREAREVEEKLERATNLISSLTGETGRWRERSQSFQHDFDCIRGNSILSAAFVSYCGYLEQQKRNDSLNKWKEILQDNRIQYNESYSFIDFMTKPQDLIDWSDKDLPKDDLCIQNAIILNSLRGKIPFIIDPAGHAAQFICNMNSEIIKTSFVDPKFHKNLESCLRFGSILLIEDGEQYDQIMSPVISKDFRRSAGRMLLDLKRTEIDISPSFQLFIVTKDTDFRPQPSLASSSVLINFSVTTLSLRSQCLTRILQFKLPDIEKKRQELVQSLASMQVSLTDLEVKMLNVFSEAKGDIVENDNLLSLLETIKEEVGRIESKSSETKMTLDEISKTSEEFSTVADVSTSLYFALSDMSCVHFLYQFSLQFFWTVFDNTVKVDISPDQLIEKFAINLFVTASHTLLNEHLAVLGFRFSQILLESRKVSVDASLYDLAIRGVSIGSKEPEFMSICDDPEAKTKWFSNDAPEIDIPREYKERLSSDNDAVSCLMVLALIRKMRPDRIIFATRQFITCSFGYDILDTESPNVTAIANDTPSTVPLLLCATVGYDPSGVVEESSPKTCESVAVGAPDTYSIIEKTVNVAAQKGVWIIVKNVHLAAEWVRRFVKMLPSINSHPDFRLFLTSEINPNIGSNVFRSCRVISFEQASGIRANLRKIAASDLGLPYDSPERVNIHLNLLWLHSVIVERLRYAPLGWSKIYEFNDSDLRFASQVGLRWIDNAVRENQSPSEAIQFLLTESVYGGRLDVPSDQRALKSMTKIIFNDKDRFSTVSNLAEFKEWIEKLPATELPETLWLPKNTGNFLFTRQGNEMLSQIVALNAGSRSASGESDRATFVKGLLDQWNEKLGALRPMDPIETDDLLLGVISDEIAILGRTYNEIVKDIAAIRSLISNGDALTHKLQSIVDELNRGTIPKSWNAHGFICTDLSVWIEDLISRIEHLSNCLNDISSAKKGLRLDLFANPECLIAAAKQSASRFNKWPIEETKIKIVLNSKEPTCETDICIRGLTILGAGTSNNSFTPSDDVVNECQFSVLSFTHNEVEKGVTTPVFMTQSKKRLIFEVSIDSSTNSNDWWVVRSPSIILQPKGV